MAEKDRRGRPPLGLKPADAGRRLLTTEEVAEQLGVGIRTVQRWIKARWLPHYAFGQGKGVMYRIDPKDLEAFLKKHHRG
jgi:excisionase family DNA binding protein